MFLRAAWWIAIAWLALCLAIISASLWSWLAKSASPGGGEATIAGAIGVLYSSPALLAVAIMSFTKRTRTFQREMWISWFLVCVGAILVAVFESAVP